MDLWLPLDESYLRSQIAAWGFTLEQTFAPVPLWLALVLALNGTVVLYAWRESRGRQNPKEREDTMSLFSNIVPVAALSLIGLTVVAVLLALVGSQIGRPLAQPEFDLVKQLLSLVIGIAVGASAGGGYVAARMAAK
jgi:hypothetical protein